MDEQSLGALSQLLIEFVIDVDSIALHREQERDNGSTVMLRRLRAFNSSIWLLIIFLGGVGTLSQVVVDNSKMAVVMAFLSVCMWTFWYFFSSWLFGIRRHVTRFMHRRTDQLTFVDKHLSTSRLADVVRALQDHQARSPTQPMRAMAMGMDLKSILTSRPTIEDVVWRTVDVDGGKLVNIPENAVFMIMVNEQRCVVKATFDANVYVDDDELSQSKVSPLQICAYSIEHANEALQWLLKQSSQASIYRGQVLQVHMPAGSSTKPTVKIVDRPTEARENLVLPDEVLLLAEKLLLMRLKHRERLARFGHSSRLGLLFYGAPGTGKTLLTKFLLSQLVSHTVVVPTDLEPDTLRECFRLAAYLEPTVVIIEDVDLLATNRTESHHRLDGLQELMNELDGLSSTSDTMVILSTNRPDVLEPALASRPGRISQAIEFPLPDSNARQKLLSLFLRRVNGSTASPTVAAPSLDAVQVDLSSWAERTERASPAFLQELCKRAILLACDDVATDVDVASGGVTVKDEHLREAIHQLVVIGGTLNANVLGFPDAVKG